jgi:hypothetical protein
MTPIKEVETLIRSWERLRRRTNDPARRRQAARVVRTLNKRLLADRADLKRSGDTKNAAGSNTPGDV